MKRDANNENFLNELTIKRSCFTISSHWHWIENFFSFIRSIIDEAAAISKWTGQNTVPTIVSSNGEPTIKFQLFDILLTKPENVYSSAVVKRQRRRKWTVTRYLRRILSVSSRVSVADFWIAAACLRFRAKLVHLYARSLFRLRISKVQLHKTKNDCSNTSSKRAREKIHCNCRMTTEETGEPFLRCRWWTRGDAVAARPGVTCRHGECAYRITSDWLRTGSPPSCVRFVFQL